MTDIALDERVERSIQEAEALLERGAVHEAIALLSEANRRARDARLERALVRIRHDGCARLPKPAHPEVSPIVSDPDGGTLFEVAADDLDLATLRTGLARSGCVLVRGLVSPERARELAAGIDAAFDAYDASVAGGEVDTDWYDPFPMPAIISPEHAGASVDISPGSPPAGRIPEVAHRRVTRDGFGVWTVDSPRMLFEWFETVDATGVGDLVTEHFGERPFLSANKCTLRRVPPADEMVGGWHQDGAFLGADIGSLNVWLALCPCGRDAPGLDIVARRFDDVLQSTGEASFFKWSLSVESVREAAGGAEVVRPDFAAGDALLFDHRLVHRTGMTADMPNPRHAIESWFYAPSAFPASQLPIVY